MVRGFFTGCAPTIWAQARRPRLGEVINLFFSSVLECRVLFDRGRGDVVILKERVKLVTSSAPRRRSEKSLLFLGFCVVEEACQDTLVTTESVRSVRFDRIEVARLDERARYRS